MYKTWLKYIAPFLGILAIACIALGMETQIINPVSYRGVMFDINAPADIHNFGLLPWRGMVASATHNTVTMLFASHEHISIAYYLVLDRSGPKAIGIVEDKSVNGIHTYRRWLYKDSMPVPATGDAFAAYLEMLKEGEAL